MQTLRHRLHLARGLCAAALVLFTVSAAPAAHGQGTQDDYYQAYYLQNEGADLDRALELYLRVADDRRAPAELRESARVAADEIREDLATADFTRLMPVDTIFYAELNRPGEQLRELLGQLGLLGEDGQAPGLGVSPKLLDATLDLRGAALAITHIDPNGGPPEGVAVLHPGNQDALRGLIETAVGNGGQVVDAIAGAPTWSIEGEAYVTLTRRLVVASRDRAQIEGVLRRLGGHGGDSFADAESLGSAAKVRGDDLLFFHLNAEPVVPMIKAALEEEAKRDPEAAMAMAFLDIDSLVGVTGRVGIDAGGIGLDLALELEEGHQSLAFNLLRTPPIDEGTLGRIPEGVAFFLATSLNEVGPAPPVSGDPERPIVTAMDFGREVFSNIVDVVVYGLPPEGDRKAGRGGLPEIVACVRVNDGRRSRALWNFVLGLAGQASGGQPSLEPERHEIEGHVVEQYAVEGVPVFLYAGADELLISPSRAALARTFQARRSGRSVADDALFRESLSALGEHTSSAILISPARCVAMARGFVPESELAEMEQAAAILQDTVCCLGQEQSDTRFQLSLRIANLPNVAPLLGQLLEAQRGGGHGHRPAAESRAVATRGGAPRAVRADADPRERFEELVREGRHEEARALAKQVAKSLGDDATALNDMAWALLTEDRYDGGFDDIALKLATRSNELAGYESWALLDTLALAEYENGNLERAYELQVKAVELAKGSGRESEAAGPLKRYEKALKKAKKKAGATVGAR